MPGRALGVLGVADVYGGGVRGDFDALAALTNGTVPVANRQGFRAPLTTVRYRLSGPAPLVGMRPRNGGLIDSRALIASEPAG